jgi:hypothetical protein
MKKILIVVFIFSGISVYAQTDKIDSLLNDLIYSELDSIFIPDRPVRYDFIYAGTNYSSNTVYAGREIGNGIINLSALIYYYNSSGFFVGASGSWYDCLEPNCNSSAFTAGFSKMLGKKNSFSVRTAYSRFIYLNPDTAAYYPYKNNFSLGLAFYKTFLGAKVSGNYLFGDMNKLNLSAGIYSRFLQLKFGKYNRVYLYPEVSVYFSRETVSIAKITEDEQVLQYRDDFGLLNTQVYLPIGLSAGNFNLEFAYSLNWPVTKDVNIKFPGMSFYNISLSYLLPILR